MKKYLIVFIALLSQFISAQNGISVNLGTDFSLITLKIAYYHDIELKEINRDLRIITEFSSPLLKPDLNDFKITTGGKINTIEYGDFLLPLKFDAVLRRTSNEACNIIGFGSAVTLSSGYYGKKFHIASELSLDNNWLSHITYTDKYKSLVYENAKEGWMGLSSTTVRLGINTGLKLNEKIELLLLGGWQYHGEFNFKTPPFYTTLGTNINF